MRYSAFGKTGIQLSALGFGAMRLPMTKSEPRVVDEELAIPVHHKAFELGVNYVDTAPGYMDGLSEITVGKAINSWKGQRIYVSTKNPIEDDSYDHWMERLDKSLKKMNRDSIDFYHLWGINLDGFRTRIDIKGGPIDAAKKALDDGRIKHLSFSWHDKPENM